MTTYEAEDKLMELLETVRGLPSDTDVISLVAARIGIDIHTYNSDMDRIAAIFTGTKPVR